MLVQLKVTPEFEIGEIRIQICFYWSFWRTSFVFENKTIFLDSLYSYEKGQEINNVLIKCH